MNRIGIDALSKVSADRSRCRFLGIGGAHQIAILGDCALPFKDLHHDRSRNHEMDEILKEGTFAMNPIERLGIGLRELHLPGGDDFEPSLFESRQDTTDDVARDRVRFDNGKGALNGHADSKIRSRFKRKALEFITQVFDNGA